MAHAIDCGGDGADADAALHRAIVRAAHNPMLEQLFGSIADAVDRTSAASLSDSGASSRVLRATARSSRQLAMPIPIARRVR